MILSSLNRERRRLLASLFFNFAAKVPGIAAVFVILPLISRSLGTREYGELLSALALGSSFTLPFGGINAVGRRLLSAAVGKGDKKEQADVFVTNTVSVAAAGLIGSVIMIISTGKTWSNPVLIAVCLLPVLAGIFNVFDNIRASYNEHYVTAALQLVFQTIVYAGIYWIGMARGALLLGGLVIQSPMLLASMATMALLLVQRPYLLRGRVTNLVGVAIPAMGVTLADGSLTLLLNFSIYWLQTTRSPEFSAWVGTIVRLFQSFMSPAILVLFPITTYISTRWAQFSVDRRLRLHKWFLVLGCGYGLLVGAIMAIGGPFYIDRMFKLTTLGDTLDVICISLFLAAVVAQKAYTMLLYAVAEARLVSFGTAIVAGAATTVAGLASLWLPPMRALDVLFGIMGTVLPALLVYSSVRYRRAVARASMSEVAGSGSLPHVD
jgi:hypothetical protein